MKTITVETSQLSGPALDWAVAKALGHDPLFGQWGTLHYGAIIRQPVDLFPDQTVPFKPSADWSQGGPLIDQHIIATASYEEGKRFDAVSRNRRIRMEGQTYLIAAMRAIVAAELGPELEIPAELVEVRDA